jgi:hypothetical protein
MTGARVFVEFLSSLGVSCAAGSIHLSSHCQASFEGLFGVNGTGSGEDGVTRLRRGDAMLEYDGLRGNGVPNVGVYCGIWGGGGGVAEIGGGLWYCRTFWLVSVN